MAAPKAVKHTESVLEQEDWLEQVLAVNGDLAARVQSLGLRAGTDKAARTMYLEIGPPTVAVDAYVTEDLVVRIDPATLKLVGLEIWQQPLAGTAERLAAAIQMLLRSSPAE